jgi:Ca2+-transporting ATPase
MMVFMNIITVGSLAMILYITPIANFFKVEPLNFSQLICTAVSVVAVLWIENTQPKTTDNFRHGRR